MTRSFDNLTIQSRIDQSWRQVALTRHVLAEANRLVAQARQADFSDGPDQQFERAERPHLKGAGLQHELGDWTLPLKALRDDLIVIESALACLVNIAQQIFPRDSSEPDCESRLPPSGPGGSAGSVPAGGSATSS